MIRCSQPTFTGIVTRAKKEEDKQKLETLMQEKEVKDSFTIKFSSLGTEVFIETKNLDNLELEQSLEDKLVLKLKDLGFTIQQTWNVMYNACRNRE